MLYDKNKYYKTMERVFPEHLEPNIVQVWGPAVASTESPLSLWKLIKAWWVLGPKIPSDVPAS